MEWVLLLLLAAAPLLCQASVNCTGVDGFFRPPEGVSSYVSFEYVTTGGSDCQSVTQNCYATLPNIKLRQRSWYIGNIESSLGFSYKPSWIQIHNVVCPEGSVLHLIPIRLDTEADENGACGGRDSVLVSVPDESFEEELCGDDEARMRSMLYNDGVGMIFVGGTANIEFCSNANSVTGMGFVIRATCIDPSFTLLPGCVDYNQAKEENTGLGAEFIARIFDKPYAIPEKTNVVHKRSADWTDLSRREARILKLMTNGKAKRQKRFATGLTIIPLEAGQKVTYEEDMLIIDFNNGTLAGPFDVKWLIINSDLLGTRIFDINLPSALTCLEGPGKAEIFDGMAFVIHTITEDTIPGLLIMNLEILAAINCISNYTYNNYIDPYPVICPNVLDVNVFPLPSAGIPDPRYRNINALDFVRADIQNGTCERRVRIERAPGRNSRMEANVLDFCRFFYYSCDAILRAACADALNIDRLSG